MKSKLLSLLLLAGSSSMFAAVRFGVGVGFGAPYVAPPPVVAYAPPCPGPGFILENNVWVRRPVYGPRFVAPAYAPRYVAPHYAYRGRAYWRR